LRGQGHGHIIQVSSVGGVFALPGLGLYHASKWGLEGMMSSLALEVRSFGVKVTLVEPAGFATEYARRIAEWEAWDDLSRRAFG
jgi:NAD(P)-dependent dehydrogenase (short-subunit alcohol dehydrogenase family)